MRPTIELAERVAAQVQQLERARAEGGGARRSYHIFFVPRRSMVCERVLQEEGVYGLVTVREFGAQLIPLEDDVLSLEQPCFKELFLLVTTDYLLLLLTTAYYYYYLLRTTYYVLQGALPRRRPHRALLRRSGRHEAAG